MPKKDIEYKTIEVEKDRETGIAQITLNNPKRKNSISMAMLDEITTALHDFNWDKKIRIAIIKGKTVEVEGKLPAFSAGADLTSGFRGVRINSSWQMPALFKEVHYKFNLIENFPKLLIAAIDGYALGGGLELALVCDLRIASKRSRFGLPELTFGAIPGAGGTQRLARIIGIARAKQMIFLGEQINAETALNWGLINFLVETEKFSEEVDNLASKLAKGPPITQRVVKEAMNMGIQSPLEAALTFERNAFGIIAPTEDAAEGIKAKFERREPNFQGK
ncbi:MAG: enoyl-CoA hydratase/isomerase family protein [Promethearchaeia archaeon]